MPYRDPEDRRAYYRRKYRERYQTDPDFRAAEAERKAEWYSMNAEQRKKIMLDYIRRRRLEEYNRHPPTKGGPLLRAFYDAAVTNSRRRDIPIEQWVSEALETGRWKKWFPR